MPSLSLYYDRGDRRSHRRRRRRRTYIHIHSDRDYFYLS